MTDLKKECVYCCGDDIERNVYKDEEDGEWFIRVTNFDTVNNIKYCPWCGRELPKKAKYTIYSNLIETYEVEAKNEEEAKKLFLGNKAKLLTKNSYIETECD